MSPGYDPITAAQLQNLQVKNSFCNITWCFFNESSQQGGSTGRIISMFLSTLATS